MAVDHWEFFAYKRPRTPHGLLKDRRQKFFDLHLVVPGVFFTREVLFAVLVFKMVDPNVSFEEEEEIRKSFNKVNFLTIRSFEIDWFSFVHFLLARKTRRGPQL